MRFAKLHLENWRNFTQIDVTLQQKVSIRRISKNSPKIY
jgi:hypothetical protein